MAVDLVAASLAIGVSFFAFLARSRFKGGVVEKPWRIIGPAPLVYAVGELVHVGQDFYGDLSWLEVGHLLSEGLFLVMLLYGFYLLEKVWTPGKG